MNSLIYHQSLLRDITVSVYYQTLHARSTSLSFNVYVLFFCFSDRKRGRHSRLPEPAPVIVQSVESGDENNSEESKMVVGFEINNKILHVNIQTPLSIVNKEDYEAEYGDTFNVR